MEFWREYAARMVEEQIAPRGVKNGAVLSAMRSVPRHLFVPESFAENAYIDRPLPLGQCQTISQPFMVARMTELLNVGRGMKILEVGTGSGYQAAVLAYLGARVWSLERVAELAERARLNLESAGFGSDKVEVIFSDGVDGFAPAAPFDRIIITAAAPEIMPAWHEQLADGGILVAPVNVAGQVQRLLTRKKLDDSQDLWDEYCRFVPLLCGLQDKGDKE